MKTLWKKTSTKYIIASVIIIVGAVYFSQFHQQKITESIPDSVEATTTLADNDPWTISKDILEGDDMLLPSYEDSLAQIQQTCPYHQPSGIAYRDCIAGLLTKDDQMVSEYATGLIADLNTYIAELNAEHSITGWDSQTALVANLSQLQASFKPYRDALCATELDITYGGNDQSVLTNTCKLYQDALYYGRLQYWRNEWVDQPIQVNYEATGALIKTTAFQELVKRAGIGGE